MGNLVRIGEPESGLPRFIYRKMHSVMDVFSKLFPSRKTGIYEVVTWFYKRYYRIDCAISFLEPPNFQNIRTAGREKVIVSVHSTKSLTEVFEAESRLIRSLYGKSDLVVAVSDGVRQDLIQNFGISAEKCETIYNFCNVSDIRKQSEQELPMNISDFIAGNRIILFVGRGHYAKHLEKLISEFAIVAEDVKDARLILLGSAKLDAGIEDFVTKASCADRILFIPYTDKPYPIFARADLLALTSRYEGYPTVLLEAMALGVPCVSMDCLSGPREILAGRSDYNNPIHGYEITDRGILVENSPEEIEGKTHIFADAMERLLTDRDLHDRLAKNAFEYASNYDNDGILKQWLDAAGIANEKERDVN